MRTQNRHFVLASWCDVARWMKNASQSEKMFVFNRDAVRELRRQLAPVVALLSDDKERVVRIVSYVRRCQAMIGGGNGTSSSLVKNEAKQSAATATSVTTSNNNNVDDESSSMQLSAADCGEWLLEARVERVVIVVGRQEEREQQ